MAKSTLLLVDDSETERFVFSRLVQRHMPGCELVLARDGEEALVLAAERQPDCAVIDLNMPGMNGIEVCRRLKAREATAHFPILLITGQETDAALRVRGLEAGADEFLERAAGNVDLIAKIRVMLRVKRAEDELRAANRRLAEAAEHRAKDLLDSSELFRVLFEASGDAVILCDLTPGDPETPHILDCNEAACRLLGYTRDTLLARRLSTLLESERMVPARMESLRTHKRDVFEAVFLRADGSPLPMTVQAAAFDQSGPLRYLFVCRLPENAAARVGATSAAIRYSFLAVETGQIFYDLSLAEDTVLWDGAITQVTGCDSVEFQKHTMAHWRERIHPDDQKHFSGEVARAIAEVGRYQTEYRVRQETGGYRFVEDMGVVLPGEDGAAYRVLGSIKDITVRVEAERERRRLDLESMQSKKLESLGVLAGGIAHDFNNILTAIIGLTDLSLSSLDHKSEIYADLQEALQAAHRAKELVKQILAFSRQTGQEKAPLFLHVVARECLKLLRASLPPNIDIIDSVDVESGAVYANATQMHQIIMNCCTNAVHAMASEGGKLELRIEDCEVTERFAVAHPQVRPGPYVLVTVYDQGHGMQPEVLSRAFDPFFTTKGPGEGTGMGLAAVHGIVTDHHGLVYAESTPGRGSAFHIYLPRVESDAAPVETEETEIPRGTERILFVDDEESVLRFGKLALSRLGYEVIACASGFEAIERFQENPAGFDLVVTDQGMPQMSGNVLAKSLHEMRPELPIILFTGFYEPPTEEWKRDAGIAMVVRKPLIARSLAEAVRDVLDGVEPASP